MEMIINKDYLGVSFFECIENDFFLQMLGYNDFNFTEPIYTEYKKNCFVLHFVLSGEGILNIRGKQHHLKKYDMFFIPPDVNVSYYPAKQNPWKYVWFEFSGRNSFSYAEQLGFLKENPVIRSKNGHEAEKEIYEILERLNGNEDVGYYSALALFYKLIDLEKRNVNNDKMLSQQVLSYLNLHYHNPSLKIEHICKDLNISHSGLCEKFKNDCGITVKQKLIEIRLNQAKYLLETSDLTIEEVGYSVGFKDNFHFMKTFKRHFGITAGEYSRKQQNRMNG